MTGMSLAKYSASGVGTGRNPPKQQRTWVSVVFLEEGYDHRRTYLLQSRDLAQLPEAAVSDIVAVHQGQRGQVREVATQQCKTMVIGSS